MFVLLILIGSLMFNDVRSEVIVRFVDIGEIVDHHCLNFLFITVKLNDIHESHQIKYVYYY